MRYVYLLSFYDEHGSENVKATLERGRLKALTASYSFSKEHPEHLDHIHMALDELLKHSDEELSLPRGGYTTPRDQDTSEGAMPHNLARGWGGMQLHVVKLAETEVNDRYKEGWNDGYKALLTEMKMWVDERDTIDNLVIEVEF